MAGTGKKTHTTSYPGDTQNRRVSNCFRPSQVCTNNHVLIQGSVAGTGKKAIQVGPKHKSEQVFETVEVCTNNQVSLRTEYKRHRLKVCHTRQVYLICIFNNS